MARLAAVSPLLGIEWSEYEGCWRFTRKWYPDNAGWERVRKGLLPEAEARDWLFVLPADCPVDQAFPWFERSCRTLTDPRDIDGIANRASEYNKKVRAENTARIEGESDERLIATSNKRTGHFDFDKATNELREEEGSPRD